ncbi:DUF3891 family protein [Salipaludibacillus daqingensis]|uniref:DUF3891 family protein n=1 Tax=Salipaludibacillus daqingensis TaxID=3041001 RepID=UPI0024747B93|nr:DUF3891 family protein [Salipaludibacillus daqingensis]
MIIKEDQDTVIFIEQHEHALISGQLVNKWQDAFFNGSQWRTSVEYAITNHDRSWIPLDRKFLFLEKETIPASFTDYPLKMKMDAYEIGIEQLVKEDAYAGFLLSCHYASFFNEKNDIKSSSFIKQQEERQESLLKQMFSQDKALTSETRQFHFDLLQLCDNLSLYLCMNHWGVDKENELSWFKDGFPQQLNTLNNKKFYSSWESETVVKLDPFPFESNQLHISIPYKRLAKKEIGKVSLKETYRNTPYDYHPVMLKK